MSDHAGSVLRLLESRGRELYALLVRITLREDVGEDLLQELFVRLTKSPEFTGADNQFAYARTCAARLAFDWRRRNKVRHAESLTVEPCGVDDSPLASVIHAEEIENVLEAMGQLNSADCDILTMRFLDGVSYEEIADDLSTSPATARSRCSKAMQKLRGKLNALPVREDLKGTS